MTNSHSNIQPNFIQIIFTSRYCKFWLKFIYRIILFKMLRFPCSVRRMLLMGLGGKMRWPVNWNPEIRCTSIQSDHSLVTKTANERSHNLKWDTQWTGMARRTQQKHHFTCCIWKRDDTWWWLKKISVQLGLSAFKIFSLFQTVIHRGPPKRQRNKICKLHKNINFMTTQQTHGKENHKSCILA